MNKIKATSIQEYNKLQTEGDRAICETLNKIIDKHFKGTESKIWHGNPVWFLEGNPIVGYSKQKSSVCLLFWSGQSFGEPELKPEGSFKAAEARYTDVSQIDEGNLIRWLNKSKEIQWDYKNIVKRRGKLEQIS